MAVTAEEDLQSSEEPINPPRNVGPKAQEGSATAPVGPAMVCPACGGINLPEAIFCTNPACHKALGDFKYVLEELRAGAQWHHVMADRVTAMIVKPHFVAAHFLWFVVWVALNAGIFAFIRTFDEYPFFLLVTILAVETILITIFVLISNTRQSTHADKRAELDYEVNVLIYREITKIHTMNVLATSLSQMGLAAAHGWGSGAGIAVHMAARVAPDAAGSGIPHLKADLYRLRSLRRQGIIPVNFFCGALAIDGRLRLGIEEPTVKMEAAWVVS